jgi:glycosyltransferase involved in cell wall biosynthesis
MRIGLLIDSLAIGGAQKHIRQLACALSAHGHDVDVYVLNEIVDPLYELPLQAAGVSLIRVGTTRVVSGAAFFSIAAQLRERRTEVLITVLWVSTIVGRIASALAGGIPIVTSVQARNANYTWLQRYSLRVTASLTTITVSNSRSGLDWAIAQEGAVRPWAALVPNAMDSAGALSSARLDWDRIGLPAKQGRFVIGSFGRLDDQKGYDLLLSALARLTGEERSRLLCLIFGEGRKRADLEQLRAALNLEGAVYFPGVRREADSLLSHFDLYVQPSRFEGTPNALQEALTRGVPALATPVDGVV